MKKNQEFLCSLLKTTQMGQTAIRSVLDASMLPELRHTLESQLLEYDGIESETHILATQRGLELRELDPAVRFVTDRMARLKLTGSNTDSKIAAMMIHGNTKRMIQGIKDRNHFSGADIQIAVLSQKLLDCEKANIRQMQAFL